MKLRNMQGLDLCISNQMISHPCLVCKHNHVILVMPTVSYIPPKSSYSKGEQDSHRPRELIENWVQVTRIESECLDSQREIECLDWRDCGNWVNVAHKFEFKCLDWELSPNHEYWVWVHGFSKGNWIRLILNSRIKFNRENMKKTDMWKICSTWNFKPFELYWLRKKKADPGRSDMNSTPTSTPKSPLHNSPVSPRHQSDFIHVDITCTLMSS